MLRVALINETDPLSFLTDQLRRAIPEAEIIHWPDAGAEQAEIAVCWKPPAGQLAAMPNLRLVHSIGAGVDNIVLEPKIPGVPLCRVVDPRLAAAMAEYVLWCALYFHRRFDQVIANGRAEIWHRYEQTAAADIRVGLLGLGAIGQTVARLLVRAGYRVSGWSRTPKAIEGVEIHAGDEELEGFLAETDILACLLPLTADTRGILNAERLGMLPRGAAVVLCSRGEHLVADDLVGLLRGGHLRGAVLDVFAQEPLPPGHPLWKEPGVLVTPHMAGLAKPRVIADQIAENVRRLRAGEPLLNKVDWRRGY